MKTITKEEIRNEVIRLVREKGYHNVTVTDICEACGITKPTFYKYAGSKEDILIDYYDIIIDQILKDLVQLVSADSHYEQLICIFSQLISHTRTIGVDLFSQMLIGNLKEDHHSFDQRGNMTDVCIAIIKKAQEKKEIRNQNPPELLYQIIAYCFMGLETMWCIKKGSIDWEKEFFESMGAVVDIEEKLKDCWKKYID